MVHTWLSDENNGRWTMVVDNADSGEAVFGPQSRETNMLAMSGVHSTIAASSHRSLSDYLPACDHGSIVITSRSREVTEGLIEYTEDILEVEPMVEEDARGTQLSKRYRKGYGIYWTHMSVALMMRGKLLPCPESRPRPTVFALCHKHLLTRSHSWDIPD